MMIIINFYLSSRWLNIAHYMYICSQTVNFDSFESMLKAVPF